jgi:multidrug resistance efflux pump
MTATETNIIPLKDSRRHYDRLGGGLVMQWRNTTLALANWSLGGVGVVFPNCPWDFDEEITLKVQIPVGNEIFPLLLKATVVHHDVERHYVGLKFQPLPAATYYVLKYMFTQIKDGNEITATGLLSAYQQHATEEEALPFLPLRKRSLGQAIALYGLISVAATAVFYLLLMTVNAYFFTVQSSYAAVTAPAYTLNAPADGIVEPLEGLNKGILGKNTLLLRLKSPTLSTEISLQKAEMTLHQDKIRILQQHLTSIESFFKDYRKTADSQHQEKQADVLAATAALTEATTNHERITALLEKGHATKKMLEESTNRLAQATAAVTAAKATVAEAAAKKKQAGNDFFISGTEADKGTPNDIRREIALAEAEYTNMQRKLSVLLGQQSALEIRSPCDCSLSHRLVEENTFVKAGQPLLELQGTTTSDLLIETRVPQEDVARLQLGADATVLLANTAQEVRGEVLEIRRLPSVAPRIGMPEDATEDKTLATVLVRTQEPLPAQQAGLPASVTFDVSYNNPLVRFFQRIF